MYVIILSSPTRLSRTLLDLRLSFFHSQHGTDKKNQISTVALVVDIVVFFTVIMGN